MGLPRDSLGRFCYVPQRSRTAKRLLHLSKLGSNRWQLPVDRKPLAPVSNAALPILSYRSVFDATPTPPPPPSCLIGDNRGSICGHCLAVYILLTETIMFPSQFLITFPITFTILGKNRSIWKYMYLQMLVGCGWEWHQLSYCTPTLVHT